MSITSSMHSPMTRREKCTGPTVNTAVLLNFQVSHLLKEYEIEDKDGIFLKCLLTKYNGGRTIGQTTVKIFFFFLKPIDGKIPITDMVHRSL